VNLTPILALVAILLLCAHPVIADQPQEHRSIVLIVLDGVGAYYVMDELTPHSLSGEVLKRAHTPPYLTHMYARAVHTNVPKTTPAHAVLFTGCSQAEPETVGFEEASIFDVVRDEGYGVYAIMQQGDSRYVIAEQDAILYFAGGLSVDDVRVVWRPEAKAAGSVMKRYALAHSGVADAKWLVGCVLDVINSSHEPFLLTMNIATCDHAAHAGNLTTYTETIESTLVALEPLVSECTRRGYVVAITSDHGMAFWSPSARGGHASSDYAASKEATTCILYLSEQPLDDVESQQDIATALLRMAHVSRMPRYADGTSAGSTPLQHEPRSVPAWRVWVGATAIAAINLVGLLLLRRLS